MTMDEFYRLPERLFEVDGHTFGRAVPKNEGEAWVPEWQSREGHAWWSEVIDGVRYRCRYVSKIA